MERLKGSRKTSLSPGLELAIVTRDFDAFLKHNRQGSAVVLPSLQHLHQVTR